MVELLKLCRRKEVSSSTRLRTGSVADCSLMQILLLLPVFWASYFNQYQGSEYHRLKPTLSVLIAIDFETYYFGVRARALIGFVGTLYL